MIKANAIGVTMNKKIKRMGCSNIKDIMEQGKLTINDNETIIEMSAFIAKGKSYEADHNAHDDLMMNLVMFGWFSTTPFFEESTDITMKNLLYAEKVKQFEQELIPIGIMPIDMEEVNSEGPGWVLWKGQ
jgi:hypothetical protein